MGTPTNDRAALRRSLLNARTSISDDERAKANARIARFLLQTLDELGWSAEDDRVIGAYWPIRDEPDLRPLFAQWPHLALPEVIGTSQPLRFVSWQPGEPLREDAFGVPVPAHGRTVRPDLLLVPCVGFSVTAPGRIYRLGYGGGYYDRTLAAAPVDTIGVAFAHARLTRFDVAEHDMALLHMVTDAGTF